MVELPGLAIDIFWVPLGMIALERLGWTFLRAEKSQPYAGLPAISCSFTNQFAGSGRIAKVGSLPRTMATSSQR